MISNEWKKDREFHDTFFTADGSTGPSDRVHVGEIETTPLFSADVLAQTENQESQSGTQANGILRQYGLLAKVQEIHDDIGQNEKSGEDAADPVEGPSLPEDKRLFVNMNTPWSTFICGSQGSGKSHTLSCMLENALIRSGMGKLPRPMAGIVFHYDRFTGFSSTQICEAAYLASSGIPVKVLVSASNRARMEQAYTNLPNYPEGKKKPEVVPLFLNEEHLDVGRMLNLMAVDEKDGKTPLYMEVSYSPQTRVLLVLRGSQLKAVLEERCDRAVH